MMEKASRIYSLKEMLLESEDELRRKIALLASTGRPTADPSFGPGMPTLDERIGGFRPGLWVLGGQPGVGKTYLELFWSLQYLVDDDTAVVWVDVNETRPVHLLALRMACSNAGIAPWPLERGRGDADDYSEAADKLYNTIGERLAVIVAGQDMTPQKVLETAYAMGRTHCMIVVDYIQKLAFVPGFGGSSRDLKDRIAESLNCLAAMVETVRAPVMVISSFSKGAYGRGSIDAANIADFKASGEVEYTCDVGLQLRFANDDDRNKDPLCNVKVLDLSIVKSRFGPDGTMRLYSIRNEGRYAEFDPASS